MKTHWKKTLNKDYLGSHDLDDGDNGYTEIKAVIKRVSMKKVTDPQGNVSQEKVAEFEGKIKPMILNTTACKVLQKFTGSAYIEDWKGCAVQIYVQRGVKAFGDVVDALRLRDFQPEMGKPELTPSHEKWAGAVQSYREHGESAYPTIVKYFTLSKENKAALIAEAKTDE